MPRGAGPVGAHAARTAALPGPVRRLRGGCDRCPLRGAHGRVDRPLEGLAREGAAARSAGGEPRPRWYAHERGVTEKIAGVAIQFEDGSVWTLPRPARHSDVIAARASATGCKGSGRQGFITSRDRFVDRVEAVNIALAAGQIRQRKARLFSEDLW